MAHVIHTILVSLDGEETREDVIASAEDILSEYAGKVFDYYEPCKDSVVFGSEDPARLLDILQERANHQRLCAAGYLRNVSTISMNELQSWIDHIGQTDIYNRKSYNLIQFLKIVDHHYCIDSGFLDAAEYSAHINIDKVKLNPQDFALVQFDLHY